MKTTKHLYIHVPFCNSICNYCDFCHRIYDQQSVDKWLDTLQNEINEKCHDSYETIYIGGGTPSCLNSNQLERLLSMIEPYSSCCKEYTIEVNPESLDIDKTLIFNKYYINRISMGVQTSDNDLLMSLNRKHTFEDVKNKINLLRENNLTNISIDLMYSLPNQSLEVLKNTLNDFLSLDVPHVSLYSLTIESNTVFGKKGIKPLNEEIEADMYDLIVNTLICLGYQHYEVSNFAKEGFESKHNIGYWNYDNFLGLSLGASSKIDDIRYTNTLSFSEYYNDYNAKSEVTELTIEDLKFENIMMSLRMKKGLNIDEFNKKYNCDLLSEYTNGVNNYNIEIVDGYLRCKNLAILNNTLLGFMK